MIALSQAPLQAIESRDTLNFSQDCTETDIISVVCEFQAGISQAWLYHHEPTQHGESNRANHQRPGLPAPGPIPALPQCTT